MLSLFNPKCPIPHGAESLKIKGTAHMPMKYTAGAAAIICLLSAIALSLTHLCRYSCPKQQRQIIRIAYAPAAFAVLSWASVFNYKVAAQIEPLEVVYESWCLCALFLLYIHFVTAAEPSGGNHVRDVPGLSQPKWIAVFLYQLLALIGLIVLEATQATGNYCASSLNPRFGHLWYKLLTTVGVIACVLAIIRFFQRNKNVMKQNRGLSKLLAFKLIVFLQFVQNWVFSILVNLVHVPESGTFSYGDYVFGLPNCILAAEMIIFSGAFWYSFGSGPYKGNSNAKLNFFHACVDAANPSDIFRGIARIFRPSMPVEGVADHQEVAPKAASPSDSDGMHQGDYMHKSEV